jgi:hypothetical protein
MSTQCSFCKAAGHNKRSCALAEISSCLLPAQTAPVKSSGYCCSTCGEGGHNSQKCPQNDSPKVRAVSHCKACGETGHNIRTCTLDLVCLPCSSPTYKRRDSQITHTIKEHHATVEDLTPDLLTCAWARMD